MKFFPVVNVLLREVTVKQFLGGHSVLKASLLENGHVQACDLPDADAYDLAFELVELFMIPFGHFDVRDPLRYFDDIGQRVGAEALEAEQVSR